MKKTLAVLLVVLTVVAASACKAQIIKPRHEDTASEIVNTVKQAFVPAEKRNDTAQDIISRDRAIELALKNAGVDKASAFDIDAELDRERNGTCWEVDFETREHEYSYDINAYDGSIMRSEREFND